MAASISFFDMEVSVTPPGGYQQPVPLTLGANWQPNDYRLFFISASEAASGGVTEAIQMVPDPPVGFTGAYVLSPDFETRGVYYRKLLTGDSDTSIAWIKPLGWRDFALGTITARGIDPTIAPVAGDLTGLMSHSVGSSTLSASSVTVPAAGTMLFCLWIVADPEGNWPSWPVALGVPTGWTPLVATDKSGGTFYQYDTNSSMMVIGKSFSSAGSTGSVSIPVGLGGMAFAGMYAFVQPAPDVSVAIGAA